MDDGCDTHMLALQFLQFKQEEDLSLFSTTQGPRRYCEHKEHECPEFIAIDWCNRREDSCSKVRHMRSQSTDSDVSIGCIQGEGGKGGGMTERTRGARGHRRDVRRTQTAEKSVCGSVLH